MALSMQPKCASASRAAPRARCVRVEAVNGAALRPGAAAAAAVAAAALLATPAYAGVQLTQPELKKVFIDDVDAPVRKPREMRQPGSSSSSGGGGFSLPSFGAPAAKAEGSVAPPTSGGIDPRSVALPGSVLAVAGLAAAAKGLDEEFDEFMNPAMAKDSNTTGLGYEEEIKSSAGGIYGPASAKAMAVSVAAAPSTSAPAAPRPPNCHPARRLSIAAVTRRSRTRPHCVAAASAAAAAAAAAAADVSPCSQLSGMSARPGRPGVLLIAARPAGGLGSDAQRGAPRNERVAAAAGNSPLGGKEAEAAQAQQASRDDGGAHGGSNGHAGLPTAGAGEAVQAQPASRDDKGAHGGSNSHAGLHTAGAGAEAGAHQAALGGAGDTEEERRRLWMAAIKPPMYSVGVVPVLVAAAIVFAETGAVPWMRCGGFVLAAVLIIAWLNLSNDAFDAHTGVDRTKRESVVNLTGDRDGVLRAANLLLAAGAGLLAWLLAASGDGRPAALLVASIACGYMYQGPPFRLSYKGLGEPLCFFAFGPSATTAFYLAMLPRTLDAVPPEVTPLAWVLSLVVGATTTIILFCSHFHQIEGDTAAGKRSPLVRLGAARATRVLTALSAAPFVLLAAGCAGVLPGCPPLPAAFIPAVALSLPTALSMLRFAWANHGVPALIAPLKIFATKLHMAFGLSLVLGLWASRQLC